LTSINHPFVIQGEGLRFECECSHQSLLQVCLISFCGFDPLEPGAANSGRWQMKNEKSNTQKEVHNES